MEFFDVGARRGVDNTLDGFLEARIAIFGFEEAGAREEEFAVELEDLEEFGGYVAVNYVLDAYAGGFFFALL